MSTQDEEPTHTIPMSLQRKLKEAKEWTDQRRDLEDTAAESEAGDWFASDGKAVDLLKEIVEMCEAAWGFAP